MSQLLHFLDVNIPMYAAGKDHRSRAACVYVMQEIAEGRLIVAIDTEIIQEILSTLPTSAKPSNFSKSTLPKELRREMFCMPP
jgi:predicted nucleic acid-binding protein